MGAQVGTAVLNTGEKLQCDLCLVGVGARPNLDLFKDHLDMLDDKPGGVKVGPPFVPAVVYPPLNSSLFLGHGTRLA